MGTPLTQTELEILRQADEHDGRLELDLSDSLHYRYYMDSFGGEDLLKAHTPTLYGMIQHRRNCDCNPRKFADLKMNDANVFLRLEDYARIENARIDAYKLKQGKQNGLRKNGEEDFYYEIKNTFESSYASVPTASLSAEVKIIDLNNQECIQRYMEIITPDDNHIFTCDISAPIESRHVERERPYRTMVTTTGFSPTKDNGCAVRSSVATSVIYSHSANDDILEINLMDPQIRYADLRTDHKDVVCISYKRDGNLKAPDYSYTPGEIKQEMPVYLDFNLTVALRNGAYFRTDDEGSYLYKKMNPDIHLTRFDNEKGEPVSTGRARLYQDWISFIKEKDNVQVLETDANKHATKLKLKFPVAWNSNLSLDQVKDVFTYADFYAMITFNTCNKCSNGSWIDQTTTIFVKNQPNPDDQCNPSKPGKNGVHVPRLYYQWGCLGKDTVLLGVNGPVPACEVKVHDRIMTRDGGWAEVENVYSGMEETILHIIHEKGDIFLTPDHTLFDEELTPVTAGDVAAGSRLAYLDSGSMQEEIVTVTKTETVPYGDKVYNFKFAKPEYLIADGLLAGDYDWQQKVRPAVQVIPPVSMNQKILDAMKELESLKEEVKI